MKTDLVPAEKSEGWKHSFGCKITLGDCGTEFFVTRVAEPRENREFQLYRNEATYLRDCLSAALDDSPVPGLEAVIVGLRKDIENRDRKIAALSADVERRFRLLVRSINFLRSYQRISEHQAMKADELVAEIHAEINAYVLALEPVLKARVGCAACDRGDFQLGHADDCPKVQAAIAAELAERMDPNDGTMDPPLPHHLLP